MKKNYNSFYFFVFLFSLYMNENKRGIQKRIITNIETRDKFLAILKEMNPGLFVIKFGAKWCGPCKQIAHII